jgi:transcriptional regulator with XRE-family HTH domain
MNEGTSGELARLSDPAAVAETAEPATGQLRAMRDHLGLTLAEMGRRIGVTPPAVRSFEQAEAEDRITLASLRRVAAAMECDLSYTLKPRAAGSHVPTLAPVSEPILVRSPSSHSPEIDDWRKAEGLG